MSPPIVPKSPPENQASDPSLAHPPVNGVNPEPGPDPQVLDETDPDAEGRYIGEQLHAETCPCLPCKAEYDRVLLLLEAHRPKTPEEEDERKAALEVLRLDREARVIEREVEEVWPTWEPILLQAQLEAYGDHLARKDSLLEVKRPSIGYKLEEAPITVAGKTSRSLEKALHLCGVDIRFNIRAARPEYQHWQPGTDYDDPDDRRLAVNISKSEEPWACWDDRTTAHIKEVLTLHFNYERSDGKKASLNFGSGAWENAFNAVLYRNEVDPFITWMESLPKWDYTDRLDTWLLRAFEIKERLPLAQWAGRYILLGAVTRAYQPGAKLDETPVLIGRGGIGKSTCLRVLLPADMDDWFSDALNLAGDSKQRAEALQGRVIVEAAELAGATRADIESLKAFLSRTDDGSVRLAYRRDPEVMKRRCVLIGTSDKDRPLPNDRNLRRFVPINLKDGDPVNLRLMLDQDRRQLWAEALFLYRRGVEARLPDDLKVQQLEATEAARSQDTIMEDAVESWLVGRDGFTFAELAFGIGLADSEDRATRLHMRDAHRIGGILERLGYTKQRPRQGGKRATVWCR